MTNFQKKIDKYVLQHLNSSELVTNYIIKKCKKIGVHLSTKDINQLKTQIDAGVKNSGKFIIDFNDKTILNAGFTSVEKFENQLSHELENLVPDIEKIIDDFWSKAPNMIQDIVLEISSGIWDEMKKTLDDVVLDRENVRLFFEDALGSIWLEVINRLDLMVGVVDEIGQSASENNDMDLIEETLLRLYARACLVASEIVSLLRSGHPDGAHARWRTLHEITVISCFIYENDITLTERYLEHTNIENYKTLVEYQNYHEHLGASPLDDRELQEAKSIHDDLILKYGKSYKSDYGWASEVLNNPKPNFRQIEEKVSLSYLRPYYKLASDNVHANPKGIFFKLGLLADEHNTCLNGPSADGLVDPLSLTSISLNQLTTNLMSYNTDIDKQVSAKIIDHMTRELHELLNNLE